MTRSRVVFLLFVGVVVVILLAVGVHYARTDSFGVERVLGDEQTTQAKETSDNKGGFAFSPVVIAGIGIGAVVLLGAALTVFSFLLGRGRRSPRSPLWAAQEINEARTALLRRVISATKDASNTPVAVWERLLADMDASVASTRAFPRNLPRGAEASELRERSISIDFALGQARAKLEDHRDRAKVRAALREVVSGLPANWPVVLFSPGTRAVRDAFMDGPLTRAIALLPPPPLRFASPIQRFTGHLERLWTSLSREVQSEEVAAAFAILVNVAKMEDEVGITDDREALVEFSRRLGQIPEVRTGSAPTSLDLVHVLKVTLGYIGIAQDDLEVWTAAFDETNRLMRRRLLWRTHFGGLG